MKVGDLVKIVKGGTLTPPKAWMGVPAIVVEQGPPLSGRPTDPDWFLIIVGSKTLPVHRDYLEVINESR